MNFTTKGLVVSQSENKITINSEGYIVKFRDEISAISFSAKNVILKGQEVLYITERCVFELTFGGLKLKEVYKSIDTDKPIISLLNFDL